MKFELCHISLPSPALREPLPVSLFAAEHAIRRPGNFQPSENTTRQNTRKMGKTQQ